MKTDTTTPDHRAGAHDIDANASPDRIEAQLDAKRADIDRTISQLESRFDPERVVGYLKENGGEIAGNLGRTFKDNPVPFLLTGVGLAWLMSAQQSGGNREPYYPRYRSSRYDGDPYYEEDLSGQRRVSTRSAYGSTYGATTGTGGTGSAGGTGGMGGSSRNDGSDDEGVMDRMKDKASQMSDRGSERMGAMSERVSDTGGEARRRLERMRDRAESRYQRMNDDVRQRYDGMSSSARLHYDRLSDDAAQQYDSLESEARRRYDQARRKAEQARRQVTRRANDLGSETATFLREQPLVAAAIGASIGALIGSLLPPSRTEDRYLGAQADKYRDQAIDMAGEKVDEFSEQARGTMEQVGKDAEQAIEKAGDKAQDAVKQADAKAGQEGEKAAEKASLSGSDGSGKQA